MDAKQLQILQKVSVLLQDHKRNESAVLQEIESLLNSPAHHYPCSELLRLFVHTAFDEREALLHWDKIFANYDYFARQLKHNVGLRVAIFDYFVNLEKAVSSPIIVEIRVLQETEKMAMVDPLTGIFNRRYFDVSLNREIKRAGRYDKILSVLMLDLDNFKNINDTKGHVFGDQVLARFAAILQSISREEDIPCRYGGEEFVVILPETHAGGAGNFAARLRCGLQEDDFFRDSGITFSGGIATYPKGGKSAITLLKNADKALYKAKFSGKDRCMVDPKSQVQ